MKLSSSNFCRCSRSCHQRNGSKWNLVQEIFLLSSSNYLRSLVQFSNIGLWLLCNLSYASSPTMFFLPCQPIPLLVIRPGMNLFWKAFYFQSERFILHRLHELPHSDLMSSTSYSELLRLIVKLGWKNCERYSYIRQMLKAGTLIGPNKGALIIGWLNVLQVKTELGCFYFLTVNNMS